MINENENDIKKIDFSIRVVKILFLIMMIIFVNIFLSSPNLFQ